MAMVSHQVDHSTRRPNKEPEWSSLCNNVFDQYLDDDDIFGLDAGGHERSSSDGSGNLFHFSTGSEQSHQTTGTSPLPAWEATVVQSIEGATQARQPTPREPLDFWSKKLRALEQNAALSEMKQHTVRTAKSHPDFLSLGGCPSPPAIPGSPTDQSYSAQRRVRSRVVAANGRTTSQARSASRGRPTGVLKSLAAGTANLYATVRKYSASPPKMMTPSRYRAGFKDVWAERTERSPKKYELRVPSTSQVLPDSPPPSEGLDQDGTWNAAFSVPTQPGFVPLPPSTSAYDEQLSPLTTTFQHAHIHTPLATPAAAQSGLYSGYFEDVSPMPQNPCAPQAVRLNDTAPLYPEPTAYLEPDKLRAFDFGFSDSNDFDDQYHPAPFAEPPQYTTNQFSAVDSYNAPYQSQGPPPASGLGISCNPALVSNLHATLDPSTIPATIYQPSQLYTSVRPSESSPPPRQRQATTAPNTPSRRKTRSPSGDAPASRRRSASQNRTSHRRVKSASATPRGAQESKGAFVNFTPNDCNKILSGVAPSGSSKTKARREKEAADKRRKLSQAAIRAIVEAGGDVDALTTAGLLG